MSGGLPRRAALALPFALGGCSWFDDIFSDRKDPLPGKREAVTIVRRGLAVDPANTVQITLPPAEPRAEWPQPGGDVAHSGGHIAVSGFKQAWRSSIGDSGGYRAKIAAQPIVFPGRIVTMDSDANVAAFDIETGSRLWRTDTQGDEDRSTNVGGGVSFAEGTVYASTGRAELLALDAATGAIRWRRPLGSPARSAPAVIDGKLLVITLDDRVQQFEAAKGDRVWSYQAANVATTLFGQAAPAVADGIAVAGFGSGDLVALRLDSGALLWADSLSSGRGRNSLLDLSAVRALPVIDRGRVFAIGAGGLLVSLDLRTGRRLWEREIGGMQTPWLAGDWLFVQTLDQVLAAINREDGQVRWIRPLERYGNPEKRRDPMFWTGPVLASGRLVLSGSNETAVLVDPLTGTVVDTLSLPGPAAVAPMAAGNTLLIVTDDGRLTAFR